MPLLTTIGLATSLAGAAKGFIGGSKMASDARKGLQNFQYQDLSVGAFDQMKPSLELEQQAMNRLSEQRAGAVDVAAGLGGSEAMAMLSATEEQIGQKEMNLLGTMMKEESRIQQLQAQDFQQRRAMQEQRDMQELQSLQQQLYAGEQMQADALQGAAETAMGAGIGQMQALASLGANPFDPQAAKNLKNLMKSGPTKTKTPFGQSGVGKGLIGAGKFLFGQGGGKGGGLFGKGIKGLGGLLGKGLKLLGI